MRPLLNLTIFLWFILFGCSNSNNTDSPNNFDSENIKKSVNQTSIVTKRALSDLHSKFANDCPDFKPYYGTGKFVMSKSGEFYIKADSLVRKKDLSKAEIENLIKVYKETLTSLSEYCRKFGKINPKNEFVSFPKNSTI